MKKLLTKVLFSALAGLIILFSFAPYFSPAKAQAVWYNQSFQEWYGKVYDPLNPDEIFGERYTAAQVQWIMYGLFSFVVNSVTGPENSGLMQCFINNIASVDVCMTQLKDLITVNDVQNPTMAAAKIQPKQNLWSLVFNTNRPISGISYVKEKIEKISPVTTVRAQAVGSGFNALKPVQEMWRSFRNVSFGLFVLVAITFAFMVMFRIKLSPQTVVSVQSALPKIIVSLILVTFSYAIAGFLIDLMYIVIGIVSLIGGLMNFGSPTEVFNILTVGQPILSTVNIGIIGALVLYLAGFCVIFLVVLFINIGVIFSALIILGIAALLLSPIGSILGILAIIIAAILFIITIFMMFKIMWGLLKAFVNVLLLTIFAPIQITLGTVMPNLGFGAWVKSYVSNLAVFVVTGVLVLFSFIFLSAGGSLALSTWIGSDVDLGHKLFNILLGSGAGATILGQAAGGGIAAWPPLLGGGGNAGVGLLFVMASFVIFTLIPKANELIQSLMSGKPFAYGSGIGEVYGAVSGAAKWGYGNTIGPGVSGMQKYMGEQRTVGLLTKLDKQMTSGNLQWIPGGIKNAVHTGSTQQPKPFH